MNLNIQYMFAIFFYRNKHSKYMVSFYAPNNIHQI